jgi:hypothetical protein
MPIDAVNVCYSLSDSTSINCYSYSCVTIGFGKQGIIVVGNPLMQEENKQNMRGLMRSRANSANQSMEVRLIANSPECPPRSPLPVGLSFPFKLILKYSAIPIPIPVPVPVSVQGSPRQDSFLCPQPSILTSNGRTVRSCAFSTCAFPLWPSFSRLKY